MIFENNWIRAEVTNFVEEAGEGIQKYYLKTRIVPKNKVSRNKVKYNWESIVRTIDQIRGIPLNHNHEFKGANNLPRGKWIKGWIEEDGAYGLAEVYNTSYNKDYIEWLRAAKDVTVSLNVSGSSEVRQSDEGPYQEAYINDWREISTVNVPGFLDAKSSLEIILSESLKELVDLTGLADKKKITEKDVDQEQLKMGIKVEMEHTKDKEVAKQIALDHLAEIPDYYTRLAKMEKEANIKTESENIPEEQEMEAKPEEVEINPAVEDEDEELDSGYEFEDLKLGIIKELQYTNDPYEAKKMAKLNLDEDKDYYKKLKEEDEKTKENNLYVVKDKLDAIANRRYGKDFYTLKDREQNKVLFSTDIEKGINDELTKEIKSHYITKVVEDNIDKIINSKKSDEKIVKQVENAKDDDFFSKLSGTRANIKFFEKLRQIRGI
jgi:hypothetical protein